MQIYLHLKPMKNAIFFMFKIFIHLTTISGLPTPLDKDLKKSI